MKWINASALALAMTTTALAQTEAPAPSPTPDRHSETVPPPQSPSATSTPIKVPPSLAEKLAHVAEYQGRSVDLVLQEAIQQYVSRNPVPKLTEVNEVTDSIDPTSLSTSLNLDDGTEVVFKFKTDTIWTTPDPSIAVGNWGKLDRFIHVSANKKSVNSKRPYFKTKSGTNEKVAIELIGDLGAIEPDPFDNWWVKIPREPVNLQIRLTAGNKSKIVSIPVRNAGLTGNTVDELIATHGMGDHEHSVFVSWPNNETVDGVFYNADAGNSISRAHWRYNSNPGLVVVLNDSRVTRINSCPEVVNFGNNVKVYRDSDLTQIVNTGDFTLTPGQFGRDRLLEKTPKAVAFASYKDGTYIKLWVAADEVSCPDWDCPQHK